MQDNAMSILARYSIMTVATIRPDGWPQATTVGYVNDELNLYFLISRTSQKFKNITADDRISISIGAAAANAADIKGLSMSARASESRDEPCRSQMLERLSARHPGYFDPKSVDMKASALIRAIPEVVSIIDFSQGLGDAETITVGAGGLVEMKAARPDNWGPNPAH